ncbi:MAG TPA: 30S ribosomal protein S20 [Candidatus Eisenbacteria bacterium]|jgi:small subunit ribosomal protein S20|nr:30S ribosomal protein S20 [Candidatus Eisenbacteria bacterium]
MPHHKSAVKRMRTTKRDRARNVNVKTGIKSALKKASETPADQAVARQVVSLLDRAVRKGVIPKAVANRRKSRLAKAANRAAAKSS